MSVAIGWGYVKWCISIPMGTFLLVDDSVVKVWILVLPYKFTPSFAENFKKLTWMLQFTLNVSWVAR